MPQLQSSSEDIKRLYRGFDAGIGQNSVLHSSAAATGHRHADFQRLQMNDATGIGYWDVLRLSDDLLVCSADSYYHQRFDLPVVPVTSIVSVRFVLSGHLQLRNRYGDAILVEEGTASMLRVPPMRDHFIGIELGRRLVSLTLHFNADRLATVMGMETDELPRLLRESDHDDPCLKYMSMRLTPGMRGSMLDLAAMPFDGALQRRYIEAKVMELTCLFIGAVNGSSIAAPRSHRLSVNERSRLRRARDILMDEFVNPPTIDTLARAIGINRTKLQRAFKQAYGTTIFDFCQDKRMVLACELLEKGQMSVAEVAHSVGYEHATNFTAAFRRHFGRRPRELRNSP